MTAADDTFTADERRALEPYFTNLDRPVFALRNLPETVKGALFARYSRSPKSLRRLFLDEFLDGVGEAPADPDVGLRRAEKLYDKVFLEYGDDSVAQLGGVHLACENVSNVLTKVLEWGRLMAYLEQSTRYVPYTDRPGGRWKYAVPPELDAPGRAAERAAYVGALDRVFEIYAEALPAMIEHLGAKHPPEAGIPKGAWRRSIQAKALDAVRGLLPAATHANVGIYGTGQAYEALLLRMRAHPLEEARLYADWMLEELRKVIPAFLRRVDREDRGVAWSDYLRATREATGREAARLLDGLVADDVAEVELTDFDPEGEVDVVAAALYAASDLPDAQLRRAVRAMSAEERARVLRAYVGERGNRRHKPGRAFERTAYRFDVLTDYGAFRDLQRHRMLTLEWQPLSPAHGWAMAESIEEAGLGDRFREAMQRSADAHGALAGAGLAAVAPYAVCMAYRVRFYMEMNAREAMHTIELRTAPAGHAAYRRVCQTMHRLIAERAGHTAIAEAMRWADHSAVELERLQAEVAADRRRAARD